MSPDIKDIKLAQMLVGDLRVDGMMAEKSRNRMRETLGVWLPDDRLIAGVIQRHAGIELDYWWGPDTEHEAEKLWAEIKGITLPPRPDEAGATSPHPRCWTPTDAQMIKAYGEPGEHLVMVDLPYPVRLAWDLRTIVNRTSCHPIIADRFVAALQTIKERYSTDQRMALHLDRFGGGFNKRLKRGGTTWSAHAFGVAFDWDPEHNKLRWGKDRAEFAKEDYEPFWDAWAEQGFMSLGKCYDFDWMHTQMNPAG